MPLIRKDPETTPTVAETQPDLLAALKSGSQDERWSAARHLAGQPGSARALGEALVAETDPRVREAMFTSLAHIQTDDAVDEVLLHLRSDDASMRTAALDALNAMPAAVQNRIPNLLADPDPDVRLLVCDTVRRLPDAIATKYLCDLLERETEANVCAAAIEALSEVGTDIALPILTIAAQRFAQEPFLLFSIKVAAERIGGSGGPRDPATS